MGVISRKAYKRWQFRPQLMALKAPITGMEIEILRFFVEHITEQFAIREIARKTKIDYKRTHATVQKLVQRNILTKKRHANIDLCSINLKDSVTELQYVEMLRAKDFLDRHRELKSFFNSTQEKVKTSFYSMVVFGSFAAGIETKTSDLDILVVAPSRSAGEEIVRVMRSEGLLLKRNVQPTVVDEKEFIQSLVRSELNVVAEVFRNHIIITGVEAFYNGVKIAR